MSKRKKKFNPLKQAERLAQHELKNTAVGCVPGQGPCQLISLASKTPIPMTLAKYDLISKIRHRWTVFIAVIGKDDFGKFYMKSEEIEVKDPQFQKDMVDTLNKYHQELIKQFNDKHLLSVGWIATPYRYQWNEKEAFEILKELGALAFEKVNEKEVVSLIA